MIDSRSSALLDYMRVINAPGTDEADEALLNILNVPVRYVSNKIKDQLKGSYCRQHGIHLYRGFEVDGYCRIAVRPQKLVKEITGVHGLH